MAQRLNIGSDTVQIWTARKKIPVFRLGHRTVWYNYSAGCCLFGEFSQPQRSGWTRKLPKRKPVFRVKERWIQPELNLVYPQMSLFTSQSKVFKKIT